MGTPPVNAPELAEVRDAAEQARAATEFLAQAVRMARHRGLSLREIAAAAGVSHEQVRRMVQS